MDKNKLYNFLEVLAELEKENNTFGQDSLSHQTIERMKKKVCKKIGELEQEVDNKQKEDDKEAKRFEYVKADGYTKNSKLSSRTSIGDTDFTHRPRNLKVSDTEILTLEQYVSGNGVSDLGNTRAIFSGTRAECKKFLEVNKIPYGIFDTCDYAIPYKKGSWAYDFHSEKALTV